MENALGTRANFESTKRRESFERLCGVRYSNRQLDFVSQGSKALKEIYEGLLEADHNQDEIFCLRDKAQRFLSGKSVKKNQEVNITPKKDLSIYIRYYKTVDYPEIAEAFVVFAQQYIANGYARILKNIRIIPRWAHHPTIAKSLFNKTTKLYPVMGDEFKKALHDGSLVVFLSHSTNSTPDGVPSIVSSEASAGKNDIPLGMELQYAHQNGNNFAQTASLEEIFEAFWRSLQALEQKYIELQKGLNQEIL